MPLPAPTGDVPVRPYASLGIALEMGFQQCIEQLRKTLLSAPLGWTLVAWLAWLFVHLCFLIGLRNKAAVLLQWTYSYFSYRRGARIVTGLPRRDN